MTDPLALHQLPWVDVAAHLTRDPRLLVPVGALDQHGPHLPLATSLLIARRLCADLAAEFGVLRAPAFPFGVNMDAGRSFPGTASLKRKTLHRVLNELLASWEDHGVNEFILITGHRHGPHLEALATLVTNRARVRVIDFWDVRTDDLLEAPGRQEHAGQAETSIMLHLFPELVRMDRAKDVEPPTDNRPRRRVPPDGAGSLGHPSRASAERGAHIYARILEAIRQAVFSPAAEDDSDTI